MKSIEDQIKFIDKVLLPFFGIKSVIDYESTFEITSEIDLVAFNLIISDFREIFPAKDFSLHKTKYKIETSNQALCLLKKCMELIQLPYTIDTITKNKISFKQVRLIQTNSNLYKYIQVKMSEIRSRELSSDNQIGLINSYRPNGVDTIGTSLKNPNYAVSPEHDLKPPKDVQITLQHDDLLKAVENEFIHTTNLTSMRTIDKDGICTINLKTCDFYDKYMNSIKCSFESQKMNGENIMSKYFINTIVQGAEYAIYIGGCELVTGTFYNNKELLPEGGDSSKQMFLCNKILSHHEVFLKIKFDKENRGGLKFVNIVLTTQFVNFDKDTDIALRNVSGLFTNPFAKNENKKISNVIGIEQLIKNEKQLWNKARLMCGMHGNAYCEFLEKDHLDKLLKCDPFKEENKPKKKITKGNLIGYQNSYLELPVDNYHFCFTSVLKKYSQFDTNVSYAFTQVNDTFIHQYEFRNEKQNIFIRHGEKNPRDFYAISQMAITCDGIIFNKLIKSGDVKLYALMVDHLDTIKMHKVELEYTVELNELVINPSIYLYSSSWTKFYGFLVEIVSLEKEEPLPNIITLVYEEFCLCTEIQFKLAQHGERVFNLTKIEI